MFCEGLDRFASLADPRVSSLFIGITRFRFSSFFFSRAKPPVQK
jgi:hypothetical protein